MINKIFCGPEIFILNFGRQASSHDELRISVKELKLLVLTVVI